MLTLLQRGASIERLLAKQLFYVVRVTIISIVVAVVLVKSRSTKAVCTR
jgi:hypothetical protein